jgi:hypothetical protein
MEHVHHAVELLREAAKHLHEAGIHEPAEEIVEYSEKIARQAPRELEERRHEDEGRGDNEEREHEGEGREFGQVLESHEHRIHQLEDQLNEVREFLKSMERRRGNEEE